ESTISIRILIPRQRRKAAVDAFDKGLEEYNKGSLDHYRKAVAHFGNALREDPKYSQAALYLARSYNALYENQSAKEFYQRAIEIDPDYLEARASYGGMLLDLGDLDESIRQLNTVVQRDAKNALAWTLLAQALCRKELYKDSIEAAGKSIKLNPYNADTHLWLGESLRLSRDYSGSIAAYNEYLSRSDYDSKLAGQLNYYVLGFLTGMGKKKRANLRDIWQEMRSIAHLGICDSQRKLSEFDAAIENCRQALRYTPDDAFVHYALGLAYIRKAQQTGSLETLAASRKHFRAMLDLNADLEEAVYAKQNLLAIDAALAK
ncbi:MAG: tetratricopeptide repeat protein, partial [Bryobacteraceae bacterium]